MYCCCGVLILICCDIRFPISFYTDCDFEAVVYVGNCPALEKSAWSKMLWMKSLDLGKYVIGCYRISDMGEQEDYVIYNDMG